MASVIVQKTVVGTVGSVYDLRTVGQKQQSVLDFSVASTPRKNVDGEWVDGTTNWTTITVWGRLADNVSASLKKGDRVIAYGREEMKDGYTNKEGVEVAARPILVADFVGLELSYAAAESKREASSGGARKAAPAAASKPAAVSKPAATDEDIFGEDELSDDGDLF